MISLPEKCSKSSEPERVEPMEDAVDNLEWMLQSLREQSWRRQKEMHENARYGMRGGGPAIAWSESCGAGPCFSPIPCPMPADRDCTQQKEHAQRAS
jgi:hypothetical protein